jgi:hypothetical protein
MFFCEACEKANNWPNSIFKSYGKCEICDKVGECNDVPSKYLPVVKRKLKLDIDSIT